MSDKTWKALERKICGQLGGSRTPLSGASSGHTCADCIGTEEFVEIKHRSKIPFLKTFKDTQKLAKKEGKRAILVIHEKGTHDSLVMLPLSDYVELTQKPIELRPTPILPDSKAGKRFYKGDSL